MNVQKACSQLQAQGQAISTLASRLSDDEARWKPDPENWSVLIVVCHLVDEEILDFRAHLDHILHTPDQPWPQIDPVGWVTEKRYNDRQLGESLQQFKQERQQSITWLTELTTPDWDASINLPWGDLTAGDMLASWLAHDLLHLRQLVELRYHLTKAGSHPHRVEYAGQW